MENTVSSKSIANKGLNNVGAFGADSILKNLSLTDTSSSSNGTLTPMLKRTPSDFLEKLTSYDTSGVKTQYKSKHNLEDCSDKRLSRLYKDIMHALPYPSPQAYMTTAMVFLDDPDIFEVLHRNYLELFDVTPKPTGLRIESVLNERQKKAFREMHHILKTGYTAAKENETEEEKKLEDDCMDAFWDVCDAISNIVFGVNGTVNDIVMATSERSPVVKRLMKMNRMFATGFVQFTYTIYHYQAKRYAEREYLCGNADEDIFEEFCSLPLPFESIPYIKELTSSENLLQIVLLFVNDHPEELLDDKEEVRYRALLKEYGKVKNTYDLIRKLDIRGGGSGWGMIYATYTGNMEIEEILKSVHLKKADIQGMAFLATIGLSDDAENDIDTLKLFSQFVYVFAMQQYYARQMRNSQKKNTKTAAFETESESEIEMLKRKLAEEQDKNKVLEAKNQQLEASVNRLKTEYKNTLEKEIIELERNEKDLKTEIKSLKKTNQKLKINREVKNNEQAAVQTAASEGDTLIVRGEASEYWHDEQRELILAILEDALSTLPENSRRKAMVQDVLDHNQFQHTAKKKREDLKKIFKGYRHINAGQEKRLKDMGFTVQYEQRRNHGRLIYMDDPRYTFALASTGSDHRNGVMKVSEIAMQVF